MNYRGPGLWSRPRIVVLGEQPRQDHFSGQNQELERRTPSMTFPAKPIVDFSRLMGTLASAQVWEYEAESKRTCDDSADEAFRALQRPLDFPPLEAAIVPGDHIAIAVDPNIPSIEKVIQGSVEALRQAGAGEIDVVISDEVHDATLASIARQAEQGEPPLRVIRHSGSQREDLRYLGADPQAEPIYLNRWLVDADFVLPIAAGRAGDVDCESDLTGIFPAFADSRARRRFLSRRGESAPEGPMAFGSSDEPAWLLGIQVMISVTANQRGCLGEIVAGTPDAIRKQRRPARRTSDDFPPSAPLVIASLDGDAQQQSWANAARAVNAASRYALPGGTIVLWSEIDEAMPEVARTNTRLEADDLVTSDDSSGGAEDGEEGFPVWNAFEAPARTLARVNEDFRLLIHSRLDPETIESMGFGVLSTAEELQHLSRTFEACGVIRAAQFAGTTVDSVHGIG